METNTVTFDELLEAAAAGVTESRAATARQGDFVVTAYQQSGKIRFTFGLLTATQGKVKRLTVKAVSRKAFVALYSDRYSHSDFLLQEVKR